MEKLQLVSPYLPMNVALFVFGLLLLIRGSDWFISSAAAIARHYKVSEIVVGLTLVSIGTSLPELATNVYASFTNQGELALGNIVGSNVANIGLILALGVLLSGPIAIPKMLLRRDATIMLLVFVLFIILCQVGHKPDFLLGRFEGFVLILVFFTYLIHLLRNRQMLVEELSQQENNEPAASMFGTWFLLFMGIVIVSLGAKLLVDNVVKTAEDLHIPKELIAATLVAFGTSVPELAVTIAGVVKKENSIALGNIIGSCTFNIVLVMGASAMINPIPVSPEMRLVILPIMLLVGLFLTVFMRSGQRLVKAEGFCLLGLYIAFIGYNLAKMYKLL